eukprot:413832-Amphidinium_carterae.1
MVDAHQRPTPAYYRWLKKTGPSPPIALHTSTGGIATDMSEVFHAHWTFWEEIVCEDACSDDPESVRAFLRHTQCDTPPLTGEMLWYTRSFFHVRTASGPDNVQGGLVRHLSLDACSVLALIFEYIE